MSGETGINTEQTQYRLRVWRVQDVVEGSVRWLKQRPDGAGVLQYASFLSLFPAVAQECPEQT